MIRVLDLVFATIALVILTPVLVVLWLLGYVVMKDPIFRQTRVGKAGLPFVLYKFRSLPVCTAELPTHLLDATSIPPYGRFLRNTKLDELPQLWCVIKGDMSLVGPRPGLPSQVELLQQRQSRGVLRLRPGITGLAQISKIDMSTPVKLARFDAILARRLDIHLYLYVLLMTLLGRGAGDRAFKRQS